MIRNVASLKTNQLLIFGNDQKLIVGIICDYIKNYQVLNNGINVYILWNHILCKLDGVAKHHAQEENFDFIFCVKNIENIIFYCIPKSLNKLIYTIHNIVWRNIQIRKKSLAVVNMV